MCHQGGDRGLPLPFMSHELVRHPMGRRSQDGGSGGGGGEFFPRGPPWLLVVLDLSDTGSFEKTGMYPLLFHLSSLLVGGLGGGGGARQVASTSVTKCIDDA